ncbi:dynein regulatory complex protein 11 isoform X8 [Marmota marmota marmota]|uniref:dynein regulatory complex protein 11 isoform X8 n=1 Tax=Marmota marmota marmota TaxID=9994 RepID=UPI00209325CA|nr:dynein regulatory complex protein 11 isoform X8 [Marmota marmota marmota]
MSNAMYNKMWHQTQEALNSLLDKESQKLVEQEKNPVYIFQMLATFYIKYVQIFRNLENVYDQIVHPQKRLLIRKILDGVMGRILELKNDMVELELSEFHYFDDILQDLKLAPQQLDIPIPKYFLKEKIEVIRERKKILAQILADSGLDATSMKLAIKSMPFEEAIKLIQIAERARQGRLRALFMKQIYLQEYRAKQARLLGEKVADTGAAALRIQKVWRGFCQSKRTEREREEEMIFLGMNPPPLFDQVSATIIQAEKVSLLRSAVQLRHEEGYREALVTIKNDLQQTEGPDIKESLRDQIRQWFIECRNLTGSFPEYPSVEDGGSAMIFSHKTPEQVIEDIVASQEEEEKNKKKKKGKKAKKEEKKKVVKEKPKEEEEEWKMSRSAFLPSMKEGSDVYKGEYSYLGTTLRHVSIEPMPSLLDVRQLITLYGILPLGSAAVHEKAPLVKSLLLAGPSGVGKKMLVHTICTETGANLFNLSAANIAGKYPGKNGLQMMLHMVFKVARQLQPSVVWIEDAEKTFYKKVPNNEKMNDPKRLKKQLPKILKLLKPDDRILIVGTTQHPFDAELQSFCRAYQKIILVPRPDYASRYVLWKQIIQRNGGVLTKALNISCLAKVTDGFTQGNIVKVVKGVLTDRRIRQQTQKPLTPAEFIPLIASMNPVYKEEEECFKNWYAKTPLGRKRVLSLTVGGREKETEKGKKKGEKERKKNK